MAGNTPDLEFTIEARVTDLEKKMKRASKAAADNFGAMQASSRKFTKQVDRDMSLAAEATTNFGKSFVAGLGVAGFTAIAQGVVSQVRGITGSMADLAATAQTAGVGLAAFQELSYVAGQSRIGVDALTDGLKELQLRTDEFIATGTGSAAESFQRLGISAQEAAQMLQRPDDMLQIIIGRVAQLDKAAQIRITDELFGGTAGEQFLRLVDLGEKGIAGMRDRARELGIVLSDEAVNGAAALDKRFAEFMLRFDVWYKGRLMDAINLLNMEIGTSPTQRLAAELGAGEQPALGANGRPIFLSPVGRGASQRDLEELFGTQLTYNQPTPTRRIGGSTGIGSGATYAQLEQMFGLDKPSTGSRGAGSIAAGINAATQATTGFNTALQGLSVQATRVNELGETMRDSFEGLFTGLAQDLIRGAGSWQTFGQAASDALGSIADKALSMAASGIFDMLFGALGSSWHIPSSFKPGGFFPAFPGFANGTNFAPGGWSWVGEDGPELLNIPRGSQVIPNDALRNMGSTSVHISVDVTGARGNAEIQAMVASGVQAGMKQMTKQMPNIMRDVTMRMG